MTDQPKQPSAADKFYAGGKAAEPEFIPRIDAQGWIEMKGGGWWKPTPGSGFTAKRTRPFEPETPANVFYPTSGRKP